MIKNYFITAFRRFLRNKFFSLINITGLAIGISASLVIFLLVRYDYSFDTFHQDRDRIYRVVEEFSYSGHSGFSSGVPSPMGNAIYIESTGIDLAAAFRTWNDPSKVTIPVDGKGKPLIFKQQKNKVFVDKNYFRLIKYRWIIGTPETSLNDPDQVVLTESRARLYFPGIPVNEIPGKLLIFNDTIKATVTGIVEDIKQNTDFSFMVFISRSTLESTSLKPDDWGQWDNITTESQLFVKLSPGVSPERIGQLVNKIYNSKRIPDPNVHETTKFDLQPLADLHFNSKYDNFDQRIAHKPTLAGLIAVAFFLLILGCINFINLTTAQSSQRGKEIGIRKTLGSFRGQLVVQFLTETFILTLAATFLSVVLTPVLLRAFSGFIPANLHFTPIQPVVILFLLGLTVFITLLSGLYPAFVLSSFKPIAVLKSQFSITNRHGGKAWLRKTLTISQFVIAQFFIISTILVSKQIQFTLNKDLGFKKEGIIFFSTNESESDKKALLLERLKSIPEIKKMSLGYSNPGSHNTWTTMMKYLDGKKEIESSIQVILADTNYIGLYQLKLLAGNNISNNDSLSGILINESMMHLLGFNEPQKAIGKIVEWNLLKSPVAGVLADFHQRSLHEPITPLLVSGIFKTHHTTFSIELPPQNAGGTVWKHALSKIKKMLDEIYPDDDIEINFIDESLAKYYVAEKNISRLLIWATGLSIIISCLGLLGLVVFITNQKTKEIGIRKVVGAEVSQIITLLSKNFIKLILAAFLIAIPLSWYAANKWLENFAYKTTLSWWVFIAGGGIMLFISLIILIIKTYLAATASPVKTLRSE
jgi:putative ABC transport system permease protein